MRPDPPSPTAAAKGWRLVGAEIGGWYFQCPDCYLLFPANEASCTEHSQALDAPTRLPIEVVIDTLTRVPTSESWYETARQIIEDLEAAGWFLDAGEPLVYDGSPDAEA